MGGSEETQKSSRNGAGKGLSNPPDWQIFTGGVEEERTQNLPKVPGSKHSDRKSERKKPIKLLSMAF